MKQARDLSSMSFDMNDRQLTQASVASQTAPTQRVVFLDRDGTLVQPRHYPSRPEELCVYPELGSRLAHIQALGFRLIVITNQGGLARGYFNVEALARMHDHLRAELARDGVQLDAIYHCPHDPAGSIAELAITCACRKPQPGMITQAARDWQIDLRRSWLVGDILHDVEAGNRAGCRTVLVNNGGETEWRTGPFRTPELIVSETTEALDRILAIELRATRPAAAPVLREQTLSAGGHHGISG